MKVKLFAMEVKASLAGEEGDQEPPWGPGQRCGVGAAGAQEAEAGWRAWRAAGSLSS